MRIVIMHGSIVLHDAIGNDIEEMYFFFSDKGIDTCCYAINAYNTNLSYISEDVLKEYIDDSENVLIYHHSIYWEFGEEILDLCKCRIIFAYHNITPGSFFYGYSKAAQENCEKGREQTRRFVNKYKKAYWLADSEYNALDLQGADYCIRPVFHHADNWVSIEPDGRILEGLVCSGKLDLLFVGRISPNKGIKKLIKMVDWYARNFDSCIRIHIIGKFNAEMNKFNSEVKDLIESYGLENLIEFVGEIDDSKLKAYYLGCDIFTCASEHEGFCVPIIEAQCMGLPIIAVDTSAVAETIGENQIVVPKSCRELAAACEVLKDSVDYRKYIREQGYKNYKNRFSKRVLLNEFDRIMSIIGVY